MGSPESLRTFVGEHYGGLVRALVLYCGDRDLAVEFAQEALVRLCRDWDKVRQMDAPVGWLYRVAMNIANSFFRRRRAERRALERQAARAGGEGDFVDLDGQMMVCTAVAGLPPRLRAAVVLRFYADLPMGQIADALGVKEPTARSMVHRGLAGLREMLDRPDVPLGEGVSG